MWRYFGETRESADVSSTDHLSEPLQPRVYSLSNAYAVFILAFSGMETALVFLAHERLGWKPDALWPMFLFIGLLGALLQGGLVRRLSGKVPEKTLLIVGA